MSAMSHETSKVLIEIEGPPAKRRGVPVGAMSPLRRCIPSHGACYAPIVAPSGCRPTGATSPGRRIRGMG